VVSGSVGLDPQGIVDSLVGPKRTYRYYAIVYLADAAQVLLAYVSGLSAVLAISGFVYDQRAASARGSLRIFEHQLYPAPVYLLWVPARLREEPLQTLRLFALRSPHGLGVGQGGQSLVTLGGQQQSFEVAAEGLALGESTEEIVEADDVVLQRTRGGSCW